MTEPAPDLDRLIIEASRLYIAAQRARPRDPQAVIDTKTELEALLAQRDGVDA